MIEVKRFIMALAAKDIVLYLDQGKLKTRCPAGAITADIAQQIKGNKAQIIHWLEAEQQSLKQHQHQPLPRAGRQDLMPLSWSQQRFWLLDHMSENSHKYHICSAAEFQGALDNVRLQLALQQLVKRHPILTTGYRMVEGEVFQFEQADVEVTLSQLDLSDLAESAQNDRLSTAIREQRELPFDLARGEVIRVLLVKLANDRHIGVFTMHHIAADGLSMNELIRQLSELYSHPQTGVEHRDELQYLDYAAWQKSNEGQASFEADKTYWQQQLSGAPASITLPTDDLQQSQDDELAASHKILLPQELTADLEALCAKHQITMFTALAAILNALLYRWSEQPDLVIATVVSGRKHREMERTIGCFVNTLLLRTGVSAQLDTDAMLKKQNEVVINAFKHDGYPYDALVQSLSEQNQGENQSLFNVGLLLQNHEQNSLQMAGLTVSPYAVEQNSALMDLRFVARQNSQGLEVNCEYKTALFELDTITALMQGFAKFAEQFCSGHKTIAELALPEVLSKQQQRYQVREPIVKVSATFVAEPLKASIEHFAAKLGKKVRLSFETPNQVLQTLVQNDNKSLIEVYLIKLDDWYGDSAEQLNANVTQFIAALKAKANASNKLLRVLLCPLDSELDVVKLQNLKAQQQQIALQTQDIGNIRVTECDRFDGYGGLPDDYFDRVAFDNAMMPYSQDTYDVLGAMVLRQIYSHWIVTPKVLVLDCDNTLWRGVCGEVGPLGIEITEAHRRWQKCIGQFKQQGILLCLCSKNNLVDVQAVFEQNPDMLLSWQDVTGYQINWDKKSDNLIALAQTLNLNLNSFVFIDDDPLQCHEVSSVVPQVCVLQMPVDEDRIDDFMAHLWPLDGIGDKVGFSDQRRQFYKENIEREVMKRQSGSLAAFVDSLALNMTVRELKNGVSLARPSELTLRTNQFNLSSNRYHTHQLAEVLQHDLNGFVVDVSDKFGDYGSVGMALYKLSDNDLKVEDFLLSCRAMGRGVEHFMVRQLAQIAEQHGVSTLSFGYKDSGKNVPARAFLEQIGKLSLSGQGQAEVVLSTEQARDLTLEHCNALPDHANTIEAAPIAAEIADSEALTQIACSSNVAAIVKQMGRGESLVFDSNSDKTTQLGNIWASLLGKAPETPATNFFQSGGHSLQLVKLISLIDKQMQVSLTLNEVFVNPTFAGLLELVEQKDGKAVSGFEAIPQVPRTEAARYDKLSSSQQRLWFVEQLESSDGQYNIPAVFRFNGALDISALNHAVLALLQRHEILRTNYEVDNGQTVQVIREIEALQITVTDLTDDNGSAERFIADEVNRAFDLAKDAMLRCHVLQLGADEHIVIFTIAHIAADGWSIPLLIADLTAFYRQKVSNSEQALSELPIQYLDYAHWQQSEAQQEIQQQQLDYWAEQLNGAPQLHSLPLSFARSNAMDYHGTSHSVTVSKAVRQSLEQFSASHNVTLFVLLQSVFALLVSRFSGENDVVIGSPTAGRTHPQTHQLIGFFVNTLALRSDLPEDISFVQFLQNNNDMVLQALANQDVPFDKVVEKLKPSRTLGNTPIFQILFVLQQAQNKKQQLDGLTMTPMTAPLETVKFDLELEVLQSGDVLTLNWRYATGLFDASVIEQMSESYQQLLQSVMATPQSLIGRLELCSDRQKQALLRAESAGEVVEPEQCLGQRLEQSFSSNSDKTALIGEDGQYSYRQLSERVSQLAGLLQLKGIGPGSKVGLYLPRSSDMVISVLAIIRAGAAYVPVDPQMPKQRIETILQDSQPACLITSEAMDKLTVDCPLLLVEQVKGAEVDSQVLSAPENAPTDGAYVLYTSGSTGKPKAIEMPHRALVNLIDGMLAHEPALNQRHKSLQFASIGFDMSFTDIFLSLFSGSCLYLIDEQTKASAPKLLDFVARHELTLLNLPYAMVDALTKEAQSQHRVLPALQAVISTAEKLVISDTMQQFFAQHSHCRLINHYGPSETHVVTTYTMPEDIEQWQTLPAIGEALINVNCYLVGPDDKPVPDGCVGELLAGGVALANGYLNQPELTAQKFIQSPWNSAERLYRTGDLCYRKPDGQIYYIGRKDNQVKLRGYRVELGEVESAIGELDAFKNVVVDIHQLPDNNQQLVAFVTPNPAFERDEQPPSDIIRRALKPVLPQYMLPGRVIEVDELPLTVNGKVDRRALAQLVGTQNDKTHIAATTETEKVLQQIWCELLAAEQVSCDDSFFAIGGHSLLAVQLVAAIEQQLNICIEIRDIFEQEQLMELGRFIDAKILTTNLHFEEESNEGLLEIVL